jgi:ribonuclease T1
MVDRRTVFLLALLLGAAFVVHVQGTAASPSGPLTYTKSHGNATQTPSLGKISPAELPPEARQTLQLIKSGGPFPFPKDGTTFGNREKRLPKHRHGYYREYTVTTPGRRDRGARRIIGGEGGEFYYTDDHYNTFKLIKE